MATQEMVYFTLELSTYRVHRLKKQAQLIFAFLVVARNHSDLPISFWSDEVRM